MGLSGGKFCEKCYKKQIIRNYSKKYPISIKDLKDKWNLDEEIG